MKIKLTCLFVPQKRYQMVAYGGVSQTNDEELSYETIKISSCNGYKRSCFFFTLRASERVTQQSISEYRKHL
jgi:hypothetical protein